jgi:fermentation-respiration switch protein FrsA (DUF1100 family)
MIDRMWGWLVIAVLYVVGIGFFRWLGGLGAAANAIQRWGQSVGERRLPPQRPGA